MVKRFFLASLAVFFGVLSLLVFVPNASAASPYDDLIQTTDTLNIKVNGETVNFAYSWYTNTKESLENSCELGRGAQYCSALILINKITTNPNDMSWGVIERTNDNQLRIWVRDNPLAACDFSMSPYKSLQCGGSTVIGVYGNCHAYASEDCFYTEIPGGAGYSPIYAGAVNSQYIYFLNYTINYPIGYDGVDVPGSAPEPPDYQNTQYSWSVSQAGSVSVRYSQNLPFELNGYSRLKIYKCTGDDYENCSTVLFDNLDVPDAQTAFWSDPFSQPPKPNVDLKLPERGNYIFQVYILNNTQDVVGAGWEVKWDGRSHIAGQTDPDAAFTVYDYMVNPVFNALNSLSAPTFGVQAIVQAPLLYLNTLSSQVGNCTAITLPNIRFLNLTYECLSPPIKSNFPAMAAAWTVISTGIIVYWCTINLFAFFKKQNDPNDDKIEVFKL